MSHTSAQQLRGDVVDPNATSPEFDAFIERMTAAPFAADTTPMADLRSNFEKFAGSFHDIPETTSFEPVDADGVEAEWAIADGADRTSAIVYLHGGGYAIGSIAAYRDHCARLSLHTGLAVLSVGYRLAPENPFPAALDDVITAYRWAAGSKGANISASRLVIAGDSAGGGLTVSALVALRDAGDVLPAAAVCLSPLSDLAHTGASVTERAHLDPIVSPAGSHAYAVRYLGEDGDYARPDASPLFAQLHGLPPLLIQVGTSELLLDDSIRLARRVRDAGGEADLDVWPQMVHIFAFFASQIPESLRAVEYIARFVAHQLERASHDHPADPSSKGVHQ
ncbi:MAG: epsilon-lactone hydrolase [Subtercola sp.]|nr:epsilon-lactone hydrolase [Subtercola sp.]